MTYWLIPLVAAVASLALAIFVNRAGGRKQASQVFTFLACMLVFWNLNFFALYYVADRDLAFYLTRIFRLGAVFVSPAVLHLIASLRPRREPVWQWVVVLNYALGAALAVANAFDLLVTDLRQFDWGYYSVAGPAYNVFSTLVLLNLLGAIVTLVHDYRTTTDPRMRVQLKFWLVGVVVVIPLGCTNLLPAYGIPFYPLGNLGTAAWAGIVAYAIVRHRLLDIHLVVSRGMAYAAVSGLLILPLFGLSVWLQTLSFGSAHPDFSFATLVMLICVSVLFPILRQKIEPRIERSWIREKREYRTAIVEFTRNIVRILDRQRLIRDLASTLMEALSLDRVVVALSDETHTTFCVTHALGVVPSVGEFHVSHPIFASLAKHQGAVLRDELEASSDANDEIVVTQVLSPNGWEVCIPLRSGGLLLGFIALGPKPTLEPFFVEDLELLETLAAEASVALENSRLYEELKKSQDIIRRADRSSALGTLAAGIAHEIRNPLVSIQTFFQLAPNRLDDGEFMTEFLDMTANEVKRISRLINELLSFARSPTPSYGAVDLNQLVERVVLLISPEARKQRLKLEHALAPNVPAVYGDGEQITQVLVNLAFNALQATPTGGTVSVKTGPALRHGQTFGRVSVCDTGCGISAEQMDNIFNPFFTTKVKGTGLGLAIAQRIVTEHGGVLSVESEVGSGAEFHVDLPQISANGDQLHADRVNLETGLEGPVVHSVSKVVGRR